MTQPLLQEKHLNSDLKKKSLGCFRVRFDVKQYNAYEYESRT